MSNTNSLLLIGNNKEDILKFRSKLMLLRDVDSVIEATTQDAFAASKKHIPEAVIIFAQESDEHLFDVVGLIKTDPLLKHTPVIFLLHTFSEEFVLSAFDAGISDYILLPAKDSEILMRVIWALQKSETLRDLAKKENLLEELSVMNKRTGAYKTKYVSKVFSNEISSAIRYKYPLSFISISLSEQSKPYVNENTFTGAIKKSLRTSDILGVPESDKYYIILPKTKLKGIFTVTNRIKENLPAQVEFFAGGCELDESMDYKAITYLVDNALQKAIETGDKIVIADKFDNAREQSKQDWLNKIQTTNKNYKLFKQAFNKKLKNVIEPVFYQAQQNLENKYDDKVVIDQFTTESKCFFSIKNHFDSKEVILKITDMGFSKVAIDKFYNIKNQHNNEQEKIELSELDSKKLINIVEALSEKYDSL